MHEQLLRLFGRPNINVHVFSSLYYWIFHLYQAQLIDARKKQSRDDIVSKLEHFGLTHDSADRGEALIAQLHDLKRTVPGTWTVIG